MTLRIGNGCGFWGDNLDAPIDLARDGRLDVLTLEYLAELTMSILALQKQRDPSAGYAGDFLDVLERLTPHLKTQPRLRVVTNAGGMNPGETPDQAATRETLEETGWRAGPLRPLVHFSPTNGISDQVFHTFVADGATYVGEPTDVGESERIEWIPMYEVRRILRDNEMLDGMSLTAVAYALAFGELD